MKILRKSRRTLVAGLVLLLWQSAQAGPDTYSPPARLDHPTQVFWGDTHLHTNLSGDAVFRLGPDAAYRFAKGETVEANSGQPAKLARPLDFIVVADHGNNMGAQITRRRVNNTEGYGDTAVGQLWLEASKELLADPATNRERLLTGSLWPGNKRDVAIRHPGFRRHIWQEVLANAERYNEPGRFTAFIGYEWTSNYRAIHRVVVFRDDADKVSTVLPFTSWDSPRPEDLWTYLANYAGDTGGDAIAIPHNSNLTYGTMFAPTDGFGEPISRNYANFRMRWEPIVEATQIKGDSETHPTLSPDDEFADFEIWNGWAGRVNGGVMWTGNNAGLRPDNLIQYEYVRSAYKLGLGHQSAVGANPFKFGMIGSTDSHTALATADEDNFFGKTMVAEPKADRATQAYSVLNWEMNAAGYAAVWATENTRNSLFEAMRRRETYATTGPRMTVRFFGGWEFAEDDANRPDLARIGYTRGVPMGGDLTTAPAGKAPSFIIHAARDPMGANLDRLQIVKGWRDAAGELHEKVYNVAASDGRRIQRNAVKRVRSTVDVETASYTNDVGDPELSVVWQDADFDPDQLAFYYVRVLQIPTPRWTAYDAELFDVELPDHIPLVTQDRAYTSPIWYTP
jgi:hypothetical protein